MRIQLGVHEQYKEKIVRRKWKEKFFSRAKVVDSNNSLLYTLHMQNIPAIHNQQIFLALEAAARVIESMEARLAIHGKSTDLSSVAAFNGVHFPAFLMALAENVPMEEKDKTEWQTFLDKNIN